MAAAADTDVEVRAVAKWVRVSPRKAQVVAANIRGRTVPEARTVLAFTQRAAAREIEKVLRSAVANAAENHSLPNDAELIVSGVQIDEGPTLKRHRPRARGRVGRILKRTCHITVRVAPNPKPKAARPKPAATPTTAEAPRAEEKATTRRKRAPKTEEATA